MGFDQFAMQFLLASKRDGTDFGQTLTLGHQELFVSEWQAEQLGLEASIAHETFGDRFLQLLGASAINVMDASAFEGADIVHDLNIPVPEELEDRYTTVIDSGTLEHVFDLRTALRSCLSMVKLGGHFISITPTNNEAGHGFYQFSPELWFRVLSAANGFSIETMLIREMHPRGRWYRVSDPGVLGGRVSFRSRHATYLFVRARRDANTAVLQEAPQQSDYRLRWDGNMAKSAPARPLSLTERVKKSARIRFERLEDRVRTWNGTPVSDPFRRVHFAEHVRHFEPIIEP